MRSLMRRTEFPGHLQRNSPLGSSCRFCGNTSREWRRRRTSSPYPQLGKVVQRNAKPRWAHTGICFVLREHARRGRHVVDVDRRSNCRRTGVEVRRIAEGEARLAGRRRNTHSLADLARELENLDRG